MRAGSVGELDSLRRWKAEATEVLNAWERVWEEATEVLNAWERVWEALGCPGAPGMSKAAACEAESKRLRGLP